MLKASRFLTLLALAFFASLTAQAQAPGILGQTASQKVGTVAIRFMGTANVSEQVVRANMQIREGAEFDEIIIDRDIRSLYRTGLFEFIEVKREALPGKAVNLVYEVTPRFRVLSVRFEGATKKSDRRLDKEVKTQPNGTLDERQVKEDAEKLREYYQKEGYNQVSINYSIERNRETGFGTVTFKIKEGNRVKISDVRFVGNQNIKARSLLGFWDGPLTKQMETKRRWWLSWLTGSGRFQDEVFEDDLDKVRDYYREQGFLDVEIPINKVQYDYPKKGKLVVTIFVNEGKRYKIGEISFSGNKLYRTELLRYLLKEKSGNTFTPSKIDKDVETLEDFYSRDGYLETRIRVLRKPNLTTGDIDIEYQVNESEQFQVESVKIEGNTVTKSVVILRELVLSPGEIFDGVRMKVSKLRLENTRFFENVNMSPETTNIPGRRNLKITVEEGRTGSLSFGAGFSSLEKALFFAEFTQSNFDLFNRKSFFRGDGQKFRLKLQLGSRSSEAIASFEEPWLLERPVRIGTTLYRTTSEYEGQYYDDLQIGGEVYIGKNLFELVEGQVSYNYEHSEYTNITEAAAAQFGINPGEAITSDASTVTFTLTRDTRDKIINTTSGNRVQLINSISGGPFGADLNFYRMEFRGAQYFQVFDAQEQVISVVGRLGTIKNFGDTQPGRESFSSYRFRYFTLGGSNTLRGFENRDVGPKLGNTGITIGGQSYGFLSLEYSIEIVNPIRFAMFYDAGFVNADSFDFNPSGYNDNFGFGIRMFVAGAPVALDLGIPLTTDKFNDEGNQFNFSFGTRF